MKLKLISLGLALVCLVTGVFLLGAHIAGAGDFLVVGLALTAIGAAVGSSAAAQKG